MISTPLDLDRILQECIHISQEAGALTLSVFSRDLRDKGLRYKQPGHPVTEADRLSHRHIVERLETLTPSIPVISEESDLHLLPEDCRMFWLVDPLDGTKEFIKGSGKYTVNIALINDGVPILGVIDVPVFQLTYYGGHFCGFGVFRNSSDDRDIHASPQDDHHEDRKRGPPYIVSLSQSHRSSEDDRLLSRITEEVEIIQDYCGSSLKFCRVAEGRSHFYVRLGPTMEWDTAAGQAIVMSAGGKVMDWSLTSLGYNKKNFRNPGLIVVDGNSPELDAMWKRFSKDFIHCSE